MNTEDIFAAGLGLTDPWYVSDVVLKPSEEDSELELHISVDFKRGAAFNILDDNGNIQCDSDGKPLELKATDTVERTWRHLNFFQYKTFLHARVPKVRWNGKCPQISVPWARKHSGFTLLFEAMVLEYAKHMTIAVLARLLMRTTNGCGLSSIITLRQRLLLLICPRLRCLVWMRQARRDTITSQ